MFDSTGKEAEKEHFFSQDSANLTDEKEEEFGSTKSDVLKEEHGLEEHEPEVLPEAVPHADAPRPETDEVAELREKLLRALADMENLRCRTRKEVENASEVAVACFARSILKVHDSLEFALASLPASETDTPFVEGIRLVSKQLIHALKNIKVVKYESFGEKFDPNLHHAVLEIPVNDAASGRVMRVLEDGFYIGDKVLRPASVAVSKLSPGEDQSEDK